MTSTPAGVSVPARKGTFRCVEFANDVEFVGDEFFADGERVDVERFEDALLRVLAIVW